MPRSSPRKVSRRWVTVNGLIAGLSRFGVPVMTVRYEDLVTKPVAVLADVLRLEDPRAVTPRFEFVADDTMVVPQTHIIAAGRIRLSSGELVLRLDEEWRREMPTQARRVVNAMTLPSRWRYGYR